MAHEVKYPDRTVYRYLYYDLRNPEYKVFRSREALARAIRKQQDEGSHSQDWTPVVSLQPHEGF